MEPGERLRRAREAKGLSAAELAERVGRSESAVRNQENGTNGIPATLAAKYAKALGVSAAYILYGSEEAGNHHRGLTPKFLPVRYRVQAGLWREVDNFVDAFSGPDRPVAPDDRFAQWPQWLEEVVGDSIDLRIPEGGFAHVVDAVAMGYAPRDKDFVVVERRRDGGALRERTVKQLELGSDGVIRLWPRSTNPKWAAPLVLDDHAGEGVEVEVVGLVIGFYSPLI